VPVITTSWEICEQDAPHDLLQQENIFFQMAALQGQNIFAASQASTCMQSPRTHSLHQSVMDPAAQPFVIGVGGTTITLQGTHYGQESTWQPATDQTGATGGGFSAYWSQPAWQHMFGIATTPGVHRAIPDVALNANPDSGYWIYCSVTAANCDPSHPWLSIGGTAIAAPLWAAFLALTDQLAEQTDKTRPGFLAPWLYRIANNPITYAHCFHDITANEQQTQTETTPTASVGYDLATGLGSYQAWNLANTVITMVNQANTALNGHNPVQVISGRP
jgi:kumamolisin